MLFLGVTFCKPGVCCHENQQENYHWHQWEQDNVQQFYIQAWLGSLLFLPLVCMSCLHRAVNANKSTNHHQQAAVTDNPVSMGWIVLQQGRGDL